MTDYIKCSKCGEDVDLSQGYCSNCGKMSDKNEETNPVLEKNPVFFKRNLKSVLIILTLVITLSISIIYNILHSSLVLKSVVDFKKINFTLSMKEIKAIHEKEEKQDHEFENELIYSTLFEEYEAKTIYKFKSEEISDIFVFVDKMGAKKVEENIKKVFSQYCNFGRNENKTQLGMGKKFSYQTKGVCVYNEMVFEFIEMQTEDVLIYITKKE